MFKFKSQFAKPFAPFAVALLASASALHAQEQKSLHKLVQESTQRMTGTTAMMGAMPMSGGMMKMPMMALPMDTVNTLTAGWPEESRKAAATTMQKYGAPQEGSASMLVWNNNGPWKRTILYRDSIPHDFPKPHHDLLEQFIDYQVPEAMFSTLAAYDGSVIAERTKGEISARCDKEEMNFLALNLANDIVSGRRSVQDARQFYAKTAMAFMKGQKSPYTQGLVFAVRRETKDSDRPMMAPPPTVSELVMMWPQPAQEVAKTTIAKYGQPQEFTPTMLVWNNNGLWKRTIVYRDELKHDFPKPHRDLLEQFIDYRVPAGQFSPLAFYDGSVIAERTKGEISARCDKEEMNLLALNLANDIVTGKRSVEDARQFYAQTAMAFMKGEKPAYTQSLQFTVATGGTADPDQPMMK